MGKIPTVSFDPSRHVFCVRETNEGREEWCTLEAVVDAERPLEAHHEAAALNELRREIEAIKQAPSLPADFDSKLIGLVQQYAPQQAVSPEIAAALTDMTKAMVNLKRDLDEQKRRIDVLALSVVKVGEKLGV